MIWLLANIRWVTIAALAACIPVAYIIGTFGGKVACEMKQEVAQLKQNDKVRIKYEKIDKKLPYSRDRSSKLEWMRQHSRQ